MQPTSDDRVPVLITGGSLVGLSASLFLGRLGVRHLLVEKHAATSRHPRGRGNNVRTMELFRTAGVEPDIRAAASVLARNHGILQAESLTGDNQRWLFRQIDPGGGLAALSPSSWCLCSQNDLEPVLLDHARRLGGDIRFGTELLSFAQDGDGVTAQILDRDSGRTRTVRADYLVAADGPRSPVRGALGIGQTGAGELFHNVSVTFRAKRLADAVGDRHFIACYLTNPDADGALLPVDNEAEWVFHLPWHPERGEPLEAFTDERCAAHIRTAVGVPGLEVEITGKAPWHAAERVAERYGAGRVLLAGDAAHEMSPTGAFGSNTGIQDAHNLAWKLALAVAGVGAPGLTDTYDAERRPVGEEVVGRTVRSAREGIGAGETDPGYVIRREAQLLIRYADSPLVAGDADGSSVAPGSRAPDARGLTRAAVSFPFRLFTLLGGERHTLVLYADRSVGPKELAHLEAVAAASAAAAHGHLDTYLVASPEAAVDDTVLPLVRDRDGEFAQAYGTSGHRSVFVVRPDGYLGFRQGEPDADGVTTYLKSTFG